MPTPDNDPLGPDFEKQLSAALDGVVPPSPTAARARYRTEAALRPGHQWRLASALVIGFGAAGMALTAVAATGSTNPAVWKERAAFVIESVGHHSGPSPKSTQSPRSEPGDGSSQDQGGGQQGGHTTTSPSPGHDGNQSPEPAETPEANPEPEASPSPTESPEPSSSPDSSHHGEPTPSPSPDDGGGGGSSGGDGH